MFGACEAEHPEELDISRVMSSAIIDRGEPIGKYSQGSGSNDP